MYVESEKQSGRIYGEIGEEVVNYITSLHIKGFKKFNNLNVEFNDKMNILVGENEAGKSTILDAIKIVLNQQYRNVDKAILKDLMNRQMVEQFSAYPAMENLPYIYIELYLSMEPKSKHAEYFYGEIYGEKRCEKEAKYGIRFECKFDKELGSHLDQDILDGKIPYEYYTMKWMTFAGRPYQSVKRPLNFLAIDTSSSNTGTSFNYYNRSLFSSKYDEAVQMEAKNSFRTQLAEAFEAVNLPQIDDHRKFGVDDKKVVLETILSIYEDDIALENRGSGMESLIKTQLALDKKKSGLDVILMEEPENHLCFINLKKMLQEISANQNESQIIVATHSNMIASRLNLKNVIWIVENEIKKLSDIDDETARFFIKAIDNSFLQLLLSKKVILVEGATEFLLLPYFYRQLTTRSIEEDMVNVISCGGISYERYLAIALATGKRVAVITDNDKKLQRIQNANLFNKTNEFQHIYMGNDIIDWTWEACLYRLNKSILEDMIKVDDNADYAIHGVPCPSKVLGKMLNNKVETAYQILLSGKKFEVPQYVKDAIQWLNE